MLKPPLRGQLHLIPRLHPHTQRLHIAQHIQHPHTQVLHIQVLHTQVLHIQVLHIQVLHILLPVVMAIIHILHTQLRAHMVAVFMVVA